MLVVLIATGAIVKDYVLGSVLFAVVVLLSFAIGRGRMAASFSFAYLFLMGIFWVTTMLPPNAAGALGRPLRDEAAEDGCRSAGDSGAVLSDAQGGVFCRSGRDEGEGARPFA